MLSIRRRLTLPGGDGLSLPAAPTREAFFLWRGLAGVREMSKRRQARRDFLRKMAIEAALITPVHGRKLVRLFR